MKNIQEISDSIYLIDSKNPGNTTVIMAGVHGNEKTGVEILKKIIKKNSLKIKSGKIYFIIANLKALELNKRFFEKNMNRCFLKNNNGKTYEEKRAKEIIKILDNADFLLDIHNTTNFNNSLEFLISEYQEVGKYFPVKYIISGFDELHPGGSDSYMNKIGKKGFCLECGSINFGDKKKAEKIAETSILNFLKFTKNIFGEEKIFKEEKKYINFDFIYKNKRLDFKFAKNFKDFEKIKVGEIIAYDGKKEIKTEKNCYILFSYIPKKIGDECFCLGEEKEELKKIKESLKKY